MKQIGIKERLTKIQIKTILSAMDQRDYCAIAHSNTMNSLVNKGIAKWTSGFGWGFGEIIELTKKGKQIQKQLK